MTENNRSTEEIRDSSSSLNISDSNTVGCKCWNINLTYLPLKSYENKVEFPSALSNGNWAQLVAEGLKIGFLNLVKILSIGEFRTVSCFNCETFLYSYKIGEGESEGQLSPKDQIIYLHNEQFDLKHFDNIKNNDQFSQVFKLLYNNKDLEIKNEESLNDSKSVIRDHTLQQYLKKRKLTMLEKIEAYKQQQFNEFKAIERTAKLHYSYLEQKTQQTNLFKPESINLEFPKDTQLIAPLTDDISITPPTHSLTNTHQDLDLASSLKISEIDQLMNLSKYHQNSKSASGSKLVSPVLHKQELEDSIPEEEEEELNEKDDMFVMDEDIPKLPVESDKPRENTNLTGGEEATASNFYSRPGTSFKPSKYLDRKFPIKFTSEQDLDEDEEESSIPTMATSVPVAILYQSKLSSNKKTAKPSTISESLDEDQVNPISATFVAPHVLSSRTLKDDKEKLFGDVPTSKVQREFLYN